jgi:hypothetical protein
VTREGGRFRLNLEAFIASMLARVPMPMVGRIVETISTDDDAHLRSTLALNVQGHDGVASYVRDLAQRLQPQLVEEAPGPVDDRARAALTSMDWSTVPVEVASALAYRLAQLCRATPGPCFCGYHRTEVSDK